MLYLKTVIILVAFLYVGLCSANEKHRSVSCDHELCCDDSIKDNNCQKFGEKGKDWYIISKGSDTGKHSISIYQQEANDQTTYKIKIKAVCTSDNASKIPELKETKNLMTS